MNRILLFILLIQLFSQTLFPQIHKAVLQGEDIISISEFKIVPNDSLWGIWVKKYKLYGCREQPIQRTGIYKIDFSGDGKADLIFNNKFCAETPTALLYLKEQINYNYIGFITGTIVGAIKMPHTNYLSFISKSGFCCASNVGDLFVYSATTIDDTLAYKIERTYRYHFKLEQPKKIIKPIRFRTLNDNYRIRWAMISDNYF